MWMQWLYALHVYKIKWTGMESDNFITKFTPYGSKAQSANQ